MYYFEKKKNEILLGCQIRSVQVKNRFFFILYLITIYCRIFYHLY